MDELNFKTKTFEGPLDLMLTLISRHKLDIMDIEISLLLEQFILYMEEMRQADIELAGEFMEMAARLILIKTSSLLPKHEAEEMKKELSGALIEYAACKAAAARLAENYVGDKVFCREPEKLPQDLTYRGSHDPIQLAEALKAILGKDSLKRIAPVSLKPLVAQKFVTVFTKIVYVLRKIKIGSAVDLDELYKGQKRTEKVAVFLALLELSKFGRIGFSEDNKRVYGI